MVELPLTCAEIPLINLPGVPLAFWALGVVSETLPQIPLTLFHHSAPHGCVRELEHELWMTQVGVGGPETLGEALRDWGRRRQVR